MIRLELTGEQVADLRELVDTQQRILRDLDLTDDGELDCVDCLRLREGWRLRELVKLRALDGALVAAAGRRE